MMSNRKHWQHYHVAVYQASVDLSHVTAHIFLGGMVGTLHPLDHYISANTNFYLTLS